MVNEKLSPQPQVAVALGFDILMVLLRFSVIKSTLEPLRICICESGTKTLRPPVVKEECLSNSSNAKSY